MGNGTYQPKWSALVRTIREGGGDRSRKMGRHHSGKGTEAGAQMDSSDNSEETGLDGMEGWPRGMDKA